MCLKLLCDNVITDNKLSPKIDEAGNLITYCNIALDIIAKSMRQDEFCKDGQPLLANDITKYLALNWLPIDGAAAAYMARRSGTFCIAARPDTPHGHVATVYPSNIMGWSDSWQKFVPMLCNIGKRNDILRASQCFPTEPLYYFKPSGGSKL